MTQQIARYVSEGVDLAKAGKAMEVYNNAATYLDNGFLPDKSHYAFGWIIYYALHQAADSAIDLRKRMLARYLKLKVSKPHKLHSMILTEALRLYKDARDMAFNRRPEDVIRFSLVRFTELWNIANLRPGDWRRKEFEGKPLSSTAEKLITLYVDELTDSSTPPSTEFSMLIDEAVSKFPDNANLLYQRAVVHILANNCTEAASLLKRAIILAPSKHYLWQRLASLIDPITDLRLHVALLYRALTAPGPEQFKGKVRLALAKAWIGAGVFKFALHELMVIKQVYGQNGWHLSPDFNKAFASIPENTVAANPEEAYLRVDSIADSFIYEALPALEVRKTYHKDPVAGEQPRFGHPEVAWRVSDDKGNNYWIQPRRFGIEPQLPLGTLLRIHVNNGRAVKAELTPTSSTEV